MDYTDSRGDRQRKHFSNKKAADAFRIRIEGQLRGGTYRPDAEKVTVKEACESFLDHCTERNERDERMTRKMLTVYKGHVANYILNAEHGLANAKLSQVTARVVNEFRDQLRSRRVTVPTTRKILATLHAVLAHAISQDWVAINAAHGVKVIGPRDEGSKKITPPSKADLRALLEAADEDFRLVLQFAAWTGVRAGEQWAARWGDVDLDGCKFHVCRRVDAYREEGAPKTAAGVRTVPISDQLVAGLRRWKLRSIFKKSDDLIFPNQTGKHISHDNLVKRRLLPLFEHLEDEHKKDPARIAAPPRRFNWHALRHYAVSSWIAAGCDPKTVQTFAGHASLQVTMDRYGHLFPRDDHKRAMDQIARDLFV
ncbi:MAG TPA: site-specific integrase [Xanthobacteraceae bacterium]|nr:site-specific integrase [Xanthobacteraceae bacterium]